HYHPALQDRLRNFLVTHAQAIYFGGIAVATTALVSALVAYGVHDVVAGNVLGWCALILLAALLPASELAIGLVNYLTTLIVPPRVLPKMAFKEGTPADCATFVVMPCLLVRADSAAVLLQRLEIHYLSNPDAPLHFALLT